MTSFIFICVFPISVTIRSMWQFWMDQPNLHPSHDTPFACTPHMQLTQQTVLPAFSSHRRFFWFCPLRHVVGLYMRAFLRLHRATWLVLLCNCWVEIAGIAAEWFLVAVEAVISLWHGFWEHGRWCLVPWNRCLKHQDVQNSAADSNGYYAKEKNDGAGSCDASSEPAPATSLPRYLLMHLGQQ